MDAPDSTAHGSQQGPELRRARHAVVFPLHVSRRRVWWTIAVLLVLTFLMLGGTWLDREAHRLPLWTPEWFRFLLAQSNVADENVGGAWFSALLFLAIAPAALACAWLEWASSSRWRSRGLALIWLGLAAAGVLMSLTELGSLHERSHAVVDNPFSGVLHGWVGVLAIPILLIGGLLVWLAWRWMREDRTAFWLMLAGVLLYMTVPLQEQLEAVMRMQAQEATGEFSRPFILVLLEEGSELFGTVFILGALGLYAVSRAGAGAFTGTLLVAPRRLLQAAWTLVAVFVLGFLAMHVALALWIPIISEHHGLPLNWFPSMLAAAAGAVCLYIGGAARRLSEVPRGVAGPLLLVGLYSLLVSMDRAADLALSSQLWEGNPRWQAAVDVAFAGAAIGSAAALWRRGSGVLRPAAAAWALLLAAVFLLEPVAIGAALMTLAYALLVPGLASYWAERAKRVVTRSEEERRAPASASLRSGRGDASHPSGRRPTARVRRRPPREA